MIAADSSISSYMFDGAMGGADTCNWHQMFTAKCFCRVLQPGADPVSMSSNAVPPPSPPKTCSALDVHAMHSIHCNVLAILCKLAYMQEDGKQLAHTWT